MHTNCSIFLYLSKDIESNCFFFCFFRRRFYSFFLLTINKYRLKFNVSIKYQRKISRRFIVKRDTNYFLFCFFDSFFLLMTINKYRLRLCFNKISEKSRRFVRDTYEFLCLCFNSKQNSFLSFNNQLESISYRIEQIVIRRID